MKLISGLRSAISAVVIIQIFLGVPMAVAWEPTKPIEFVIPAGTGGGAPDGGLPSGGGGVGRH